MEIIAQITDIHLHKRKEEYRGVPVRENFLKALDKACRLEPDLLVISGDICAEDGEEVTYLWLREKLDKSGPEYRVMAGNHDDSDSMAAVFGMNPELTDGELYFSEIREGRNLIFLDTRKGMCYDKQYIWLAGELIRGEGDPIVFMHHPPVLAGVHHMDRNYPFEQRERICSVFRESGRNIHIYCGHYHVERSLFVDNMSIHITPSTAFNLDPNQRKMVVEHHVPGFRLIRYEESGILSQEVRYIFPDQ